MSPLKPLFVYTYEDRLGQGVFVFIDMASPQHPVPDHADERVRRDMGVALQHLPVLVARDERDLFDLETGFDEPSGAFMTQVTEVKVFNPKFHAGPAESAPD